MLTASEPPARLAWPRAIEILRTDVVRTLKLLGCPSVAELDESFVDVPEAWVRGPAKAGRYAV